MNDFKVCDDDFLMWLRTSAERTALNALNGISYGCGLDFTDDTFYIRVSYTYRHLHDTVTYKEKLPDYLRNMDEKYVKKNVEIAWRGLIKRSFSTEINRIFGGDFNPL